MKRILSIILTVMIMVMPVHTFAAAKSVSKSEAVDITRKIIYAVETGGMSYGNANYKYFFVEKKGTVFAGAAGYYNSEAKALFKYIRKNNKKNSTGKNAKLVLDNWSKLHKKPSVVKAGADALDSKKGKKAQDAFTNKMIKSYFKDAGKLGVNTYSGKVECANIIYQGGLSSAKRLVKIIKKTSDYKSTKKITAKSFYDAMQNDTGNQVGAFKTRQTFVYNQIAKQISN